MIFEQVYFTFYSVTSVSELVQEKVNWSPVQKIIVDAQHVFSLSAMVMQVDAKLTKIGPFLGIVGHRKGGDWL